MALFNNQWKPKIIKIDFQIYLVFPCQSESVNERTDDLMIPTHWALHFSPRNINTKKDKSWSVAPTWNKVMHRSWTISNSLSLLFCGFFFSGVRVCFYMSAAGCEMPCILLAFHCNPLKKATQLPNCNSAFLMLLVQYRGHTIFSER